MRQKQALEIKAADFEGLETCAFCDYSVILSPELKAINCLNPECKKETCRLDILFHLYIYVGYTY